MRINVWHVYPHLDVFFYDTCIQVNMPCGSCTNMFADVIARFRWTGQTPLNRPVREQYPLNDLNSIEALGVFFGEVPEKTANTVALKSTDLCIFHVHILSIYVFIYIYIITVYIFIQPMYTWIWNIIIYIYTANVGTWIPHCWYMAQMIQELDLASSWMSMNIKDIYLDVPGS